MSRVVRQAQQTFRHELPELLNTHRGQWVAYSEHGRIVIGPSKTAVYQECLRKAYKGGQFVVRRIEPEVPREAEALSEV